MGKWDDDVAVVGGGGLALPREVERRALHLLKVCRAGASLSLSVHLHLNVLNNSYDRMYV